MPSIGGAENAACFSAIHEDENLLVGPCNCWRVEIGSRQATETASDDDQVDLRVVVEPLLQ